MRLSWTIGLLGAMFCSEAIPSATLAQIYSYRSGVPGRVIQGGPLGPAPLDPYSVSSYFGWLPSPIVARQSVGHQIIATGPNGYVYRPIYADELDAPAPRTTTARPTSFAARHAVAHGDVPVPMRPAPAPPERRRDAAFAAALADMKAGEFGLALDALEAILVRDPKRGDAELLAAQAQFALGDYPAAVAALARAVELVPDGEWDRYVADYRRYFPSSLQYIVRLRLLERYVDDVPDDASGPLLLGYHYGALGFADEALRLLDEVKDDPLAKRLSRHFAGRRAADDGPAPAPEDAIDKDEKEAGPRQF